ncbi:hypothetical protein CJ030_MR3G011056 [Morella rubra]|uniref:Uncharacterized protein n=1 Tax=Morella rubra TaxID=262757 RepID=A0A6A1W374_9ROSI|nr:hypothetical protein CJ030_MR3G011056 [Morella rubra]
MRRESPINVDRRHEEEFPLWFRNRDDVMPAEENVFGAIHQFELRVVPNVPALLGVQFKEEALEHPYPDMNKEEWTRVCDLLRARNLGKNGGITVAARVRGKVIHRSGDFAERLEEARLQIEEMRARQLEYEVLLVKVRYEADDARASTDDGGAATEERRRADADDG